MAPKVRFQLSKFLNLSRWRYCQVSDCKNTSYWNM